VRFILPIAKGRREFWVRQVALRPLIARLQPLLHGLAFLWRRLLFRTTFIAVTGSLGKTTTKECLGGILRSHAPTFQSPRNSGGIILLILNILRVRPWHRYAVMEISVGAPGTMRRLARLLEPDMALILNVKRTHSTAFADLDEHAREKAILLDHLRPGGLAILNGDDERVRRMKPRRGGEIHLFGGSESCDYRFTGARSAWPQRLHLTISSPSGSHRVQTQLVGAHWAPACTAALAVADTVGMPLAKAAAAFASVPPFPGRLSPHTLPNGAVILRDDYNASRTSLDATLAVMNAATAACSSSPTSPISKGTARSVCGTSPNRQSARPTSS
jgi:UDP-N-acetylmuramoyl-tripeptide--D-alanyl-D-alanine ligase